MWDIEQYLIHFEGLYSLQAHLVLLHFEDIVLFTHLSLVEA